MASKYFSGAKLKNIKKCNAIITQKYIALLSKIAIDSSY
jgi:hypothetical protein